MRTTQYSAECCWTIQPAGPVVLRSKAGRLPVIQGGCGRGSVCGIHMKAAHVPRVLDMLKFMGY